MLLYAILPALGFACLYNPGSILDFFMDYSKSTLIGFGDIYETINNFSTLGGFWVVAFVLTLTVGISSVSAMAGSVQRRMRYGVEYRNTVGTLWNKINSFFIPILLTTITFMLVMQVYFLLISMFCFIWLKLNNAIVGMILSILTLVLLTGCLLVGISMSITILPNMAVKGYNFFKAVKFGVTETMSHIGNILFSVALPTMVMLIPIFIVNLFEYAGSGFVKYIFSALYYLGIFTIGVPLSYTIFFDINDMEREDLKTYREWGLK